MPRSRRFEEERAVSRVRAYIEEVLAESEPKVSRLSESATAKALRMHRTTVAKYAREQLAMARKGLGRISKRKPSPVAAKLQEARAERDLWRSRYENILEKWLRIEWALWQHESIDFMKLLDTDIPKPLRDVPARGGRREREGQL